MTNVYGITHLALVLLAAVAALHGANPMAAADPLPMEAGSTEGGDVATPNHGLHHVSLMPSVATPNHDTDRVGLMPSAATPNHDTDRVSLPSVATPNHDFNRVSLMPSVATPNHDSNRLGLIPYLVLLRAEPEPAEPSSPAFVHTDTMLYARANARLRAAPSTAAGVVTKLAANAPLRAVARSTDGAWWQVLLADRHTAYVHRDAVTKVRAVAKKPLAAPPTPVAAASPQPVPAHGSRGLLGLVDEAMNWLADRAGPGPAPKIVRAER